MDILMKFDIEAQIRKTLTTDENLDLKNDKSQYISHNIPPIGIHM